jgi:hypothetical protein
MTDDGNTAIDDTQTDEDILSYTVSDEALEAAAGTERGAGYKTRSSATSSETDAGPDLCRC